MTQFVDDEYYEDEDDGLPSMTVSNDNSSDNNNNHIVSSLSQTDASSCMMDSPFKVRAGVVAAGNK